MKGPEGKSRLILVLLPICPVLIIVQMLLALSRFYYVPLHALLLLGEFIVAICVLFAVRGWRAPTWKRICAIAIMLVVIAWTFYWPIAAILIARALAPQP